MSWQSFRVADAAQAHKIDQVFHEVFPPLWAAAGTPREAGIFARYEIEDGSTEFFFSPQAAEIASALVKHYGASVCKPPTRDGHTSLSVGSAFALDLLQGKGS
jgi:hypothetical protein